MPDETSRNTALLADVHVEDSPALMSNQQAAIQKGCGFQKAPGGKGFSMPRTFHLGEVYVRITWGSASNLLTERAD